MEFTIGYKNAEVRTTKILSETVEAVDMIQALIMFSNRHKNAVVYIVIRSGT